MVGGGGVSLDMWDGGWQGYFGWCYCCNVVVGVTRVSEVVLGGVVSGGEVG